MSVKLLTEQYLEFLSLKEGCTGSSVRVYPCQNATLLEISCLGSYALYKCNKYWNLVSWLIQSTADFLKLFMSSHSLFQGKSFFKYSKTFVKRPLSKRPKRFFKTDSRLMQVKSIAECSKGEHSAIVSTFIRLPVVIKTFILSIFEWPFYTGFTVCEI